MSESRLQSLRRHAPRAALMLLATYLALAVGAPWLLHDAPPSPQDVVAAKVCCGATAAATETRTPRPAAPRN